MNLLRKRPLAAACCIGLILVFFAAYLPEAVTLAVMAAAVFAAAAILIYLRKRPRVTVCTVDARVFVPLCSVLGLLLLGSSFIFKGVILGRLEALEGSELGSTAVVTDVRFESGWAAAYEVKLRSADGKRLSAEGLLLCDSPAGLTPGDVVEFTARFADLDEVYAQLGMEKNDLLASGITFACETDGAVIIGSETLPAVIAKLRARISAAVGIGLDSGTAALARALLLGDKSRLGIQRRDFGRAGVMHLLALSGLHLTVLCTLLDKLTERLGVDRRLRLVLTAVFTVFYALLTGFPVSLLRAGIMLLMMNAVNLFGRDRDPITALFASVWLILLFDPASVYDTGLAMSFAATLGVLFLGAESGRLARVKPKPLRALLRAALISVGAVMFLLPIQYARFGETSLWSIPASLIVTPMTELLLWLLIPYLIAALIGSSPIVALTALPITAVSGLMRRVTSAISQTRALVSLSYPFTLPIMLVCIAALAIMAVKNVKNRLCALIPFGAAVSVFFCAVLIASRFSADRLYAVGSGSSDALVLVSDGECLVVDMSDGSSKLMRLTAARLGREQVTEIDTCMLTHLHRKHRNSLLSLCESRLVRRFLLPEPQTESETNALADIEELAAELGVTVALYPRPDPARIAFQSARVELCGYTRVKRSTHPVLQLTVCLDKDAPEARHAVYLGSAAAEFLPIPSAGFYLLGHHGPVPKAPLPPLDAPSAEPPELFLELIAAEKDGETVFPLPERPSGK